MKFASLLKLHQNQDPIAPHSPNQYLIHCNNKSEQPFIYGANNNFNLRKKPFEPNDPFGQSLDDIFKSYQQNQHTQWILELEASHVRVHKFQPNKFKPKKDGMEHHHDHPKPVHLHQRHFQPHQSPHHQQNEDFQSHRLNLRQNPNQLEARKNYSPMQKMRPKTFGREQNWMENLNENKFSFGEDSVLALQEANNHKEYEQNQQNSGNKSYIEERHDYELPNNQNEVKPKGFGVNLIKEFEKNEDRMQEPLRSERKQVPKRQLFNNFANQEHEKTAQKLQKPLESHTNPNIRIDFNPNVGFSFEEIDKIGQPTQNTIGPVSENKIEMKSQTQIIGITNNQIEIESEKKVSNLEDHQKTQQKTNLKKDTSLKQIIDEKEQNLKAKTEVSEKTQMKKVEVKQNIEQSAPQSEAKEKESSPHRIYCKANIRNLTPQKFKYPRIESKIESNTEVKPFLTQTQKKETKIQVGAIKVNTEKKTQNAVGQKKIVTVPSSQRLQALIDESKRLLESKHVGQEVKPEENKIRRIVLHNQAVTATENQIKTEVIQLRDGEASQKVVSNVEVKPVKKESSEVTPKKKEMDFQSVGSPKSSNPQKPKFHNQLANMETNYTPKKVQNQVLEKQSEAKNIAIKNGPVGSYNVSPRNAMDQTENAQKVTAPIINPVTLQQNQNYFQSNYAYKPLNVPQYNTNIKPAENKDASGYKVSQYQPATQLIGNQPFQPIINTYQQLNEASYQTQKITTSPQGYTLNTTNYTSATTTQNNVKTYSPYFPPSQLPSATNLTANRPSLPAQTNEIKPMTPTQYQHYVYSNFPSQQTQIQPSGQPLKPNSNNNYIKINANYISPLEKYEVKHEQKETVVNHNLEKEKKDKENLRPQTATLGLGIEGVKCVESKIYEPSTNKYTTVQPDPKESSVEFSLRIEEHFHI